MFSSRLSQTVWYMASRLMYSYIASLAIIFYALDSENESKRVPRTTFPDDKMKTTLKLKSLHFQLPKPHLHTMDKSCAS